ncbi:MAG: hypothetical protein WDO73_09900 [Ignavibacteriota bacterium]
MADSPPHPRSRRPSTTCRTSVAAHLVVDRVTGRQSPRSMSPAIATSRRQAPRLTFLHADYGGRFAAASAQPKTIGNFPCLMESRPIWWSTGSRGGSLRDR